jgi:hypothetical protein
MKFSTSALFLFLVSSSVTDVVKSQENEEGLQDFLSMVNSTVTGITDIVDTYTVLKSCEKDYVAMIAANPDLKTAWEAWANTYAYTASGDTTQETITGSYDADALASYQAACTTVGDSVTFVSLPTTDYSCSTDGYDFLLTETNYGACYPTTEECAEYGQGAAAIVSYVAEQMSAVGVTCAVTPTDGGSSENSSTSSSASSMITSFSAATVAAAAAAGTVLYL